MSTATTTYLQITNNAISESGADSATFAVDGSDFTTRTDKYMNLFKTWVQRAWRDIQIECYDWEFMQEQGLCNLNPGIMFYTDGTPVSTFSKTLQGATVNIYDQNGTVAIPSVTFGNFTDLTGQYTLASAFGCIDLVGYSQSNPLNIALKPGAEYFQIPTSAVSYTLSFSGGATGSGGSGFPSVGNAIGVMQVSRDPSSGNFSLIKDYGNMGTFIAAPTSFGGQVLSTPNTQLSSDWVATTNLVETLFVLYDPTKTPQYVLQFVNNGIGTTWYYYAGNLTTLDSIFTTTTPSGAFLGKAFIHSWRSYDFNEETQVGDFQEDIEEINQKTFRSIDYLQSPPAGEIPIPFMPWETFRSSYDISSSYPGTPRLITEDDTGRYRFFPSLYYPYSIKFDYSRRPQILNAFGDIPRGINDEFMDLIMWRSINNYGEYMEQPSIIARSERHYKDILARLEQKNREKFHFKPAKLW